ncbi:MAG: enoyl-CoA hydratase/isomerase family protein [Deltaproteobacteria bacterium]|nr:enoyl-CoA hydratase/isomerase family protein [Deltaproteobacteria bacterium]
MNYETILYEKDGPIATVTFNRPEKHNPWSVQVSEDLVDAFNVMENDPEVRVTLVTGKGTKAFSAGADLANPKTHRVTTAGEHLATVTPRGFAVFNTVADYPKPVVAAVNGYAIGIGCLITLCCDIILASDNAEFGLPQVPLGILPAYGGAVRLARYVGRGKAMEMVLLGERITAAEAHRVGLANKVVPLADLLPLARNYAERLAALPPLAVRLAKESLNKGLDIASLKDAAQVDIYRFMLLGQTEDSHEAHRAWREKRKPVFKGK